MILCRKFPPVGAVVVSLDIAARGRETDIWARAEVREVLSPRELGVWILYNPLDGFWRGGQSRMPREGWRETWYWSADVRWLREEEDAVSSAVQDR